MRSEVTAAPLQPVADAILAEAGDPEGEERLLTRVRRVHAHEIGHFDPRWDAIPERVSVHHRASIHWPGKSKTASRKNPAGSTRTPEPRGAGLLRSAAVLLST